MFHVNPPVIGITIGDPAGIGPEIVVRALAHEAVRASGSAVVIGDGWVLERAMNVTGTRLEFGTGGHARLVDLANVDHRLQWGKIQSTAGAAAGQFIERAVQDALAGRIDALATAPLNKEALWRAGYRHLGHTEMLADLTRTSDPLTMFQVRGLRIFFLTRHLSLREALDQIRREKIAAILPRIDAELHRLGIERPRVAVAALNPHAGEGGALGREDLEEIAPAVADARSRGLTVDGPVPADAVFAQALDGRYDAVLSLYHDQGHIAAKTLDFHGAVSVTLGLPFVRTSVDHGTAFDIAGKGLARADSMIAAILAAGDLVRRIYVTQTPRSSRAERSDPQR
ncbi:MAG: 4-hydroxythreonine-4-phosphate dehydrogenase PdxA [Armatimonadetes bacterium]|nr:4-hydroxythreonine-4-phosphate dehydrogenase PdxA [Armatimonadota bacterium]